MAQIPRPRRHHKKVERRRYEARQVFACQFRH